MPRCWAPRRGHISVSLIVAALNLTVMILPVLPGRLVRQGHDRWHRHGIARSQSGVDGSIRGAHRLSSPAHFQEIARHLPPIQGIGSINPLGCHHLIGQFFIFFLITSPTALKLTESTGPWFNESSSVADWFRELDYRYSSAIFMAWDINRALMGSLRSSWSRCLMHLCLMHLCLMQLCLMQLCCIPLYSGLDCVWSSHVWCGCVWRVHV